MPAGKIRRHPATNMPQAHAILRPVPASGRSRRRRCRRGATPLRHWRQDGQALGAGRAAQAEARSVYGRDGRAGTQRAAGRVPPKTREKGKRPEWRSSRSCESPGPGEHTAPRTALPGGPRPGHRLKAGPGKSPGRENRFGLPGGPPRRFPAGGVTCGHPCGQLGDNPWKNPETPPVFSKKGLDSEHGCFPRKSASTESTPGGRPPGRRASISCAAMPTDPLPPPVGRGQALGAPGQAGTGGHCRVPHRRNTAMGAAAPHRALHMGLRDMPHGDIRVRQRTATRRLVGGIREHPPNRAAGIPEPRVSDARRSAAHPTIAVCRICEFAVPRAVAPVNPAVGQGADRTPRHLRHPLAPTPPGDRMKIPHCGLASPERARAAVMPGRCRLAARRQLPAPGSSTQVQATCGRWP